MAVRPGTGCGITILNRAWRSGNRRNCLPPEWQGQAEGRVAGGAAKSAAPGTLVAEEIYFTEFSDSTLSLTLGPKFLIQ